MSRVQHRQPRRDILKASSQAAGPSWLPWAITAALALAVAIIYGQALRFDFLEYDDNLFVRDCPQVRAGLTAASIRWALTDGPMGEWYPVAILSHMLDCQLFGLSAWGHHLTSVLLHAATSIGLFWLLRSMTGRLWPSGLVALVFAVHPQHVESVVWIAERRDVLSGFFFVLTLAAWLGYVRRGGAARYLLTMILLALGLMSKLMLVTVPPLLLLLDYWPLGRWGDAGDIPEVNRGIARRSLTWLVIEKLPLVALVVADAAATAATHAENRPIPLADRLSVAAVAGVKYLEQFFCPIDLAIFYPFPVGGEPAWKVAGSVGLVAVVSTAAVLWRRQAPYLPVGWFWFLGMLVPVLGIVQIADHALADRYMYLPSVGLCIALAWAGVRPAERSPILRRPLIFLAVAAGTILIGLSVRQTSLWRDGETLWNHAIEVTGDNEEAEIGLAESLRVAGRNEEAIEHFRRAEKTASEPSFFNNFGATLIAVGDLDGAIAQLRRGLAINPRSQALYGNLGATQARQQKFAEAEDSFRRAIQCDPKIPGPHVQLAKVLFQQGHVDEAISECRKALEIAPHDPDAEQGLAILLKAQSQQSRPSSGRHP